MKTCSGVRNNDRCGAPAEWKATFPDQTVEFVCTECATNLGQIAEGVKSRIYTERYSEKES